MSVTGRFKRYFFRGLAVLLPTTLTVWILALGYTEIQKNVTVHINRGIVKAAVWAQEREGLSEDALAQYETKLEARFVNGLAGSFVGLLIAVVAVVLVGALLASVVGRTLWRSVEAFIIGTPILRRIYPHIKQVTDFVLTQEGPQKMFSRVVAVEYPRKGVWAIGFVTGAGLRAVEQKTEREFLTVLLPKAPAMVSGYVVVVPKEETVAVDMTVEEACRFLVSAGVVAPESERPLSSLTVHGIAPRVAGAIELTGTVD